MLGGEGGRKIGGGGKTRSFQSLEAGENLFYEYLLTDEVNY